MFDLQEIHDYTAKALQAFIGLAFFLFVLTAVAFFAIGRYSAPQPHSPNATPADSLPAPPDKEE